MPRGSQRYSELVGAGPSSRPSPKTKMNAAAFKNLHLRTPPPTPESGMNHLSDKDLGSSSPAVPTRTPSPPSPDPSPVPGQAPTPSGHTTIEGEVTCDCAEPHRPHKKRLVGSLLKRNDGESVLGKWNPALTLENSGSVARDHLASERTFLAYVRTSLTIASTGVALVQLFTISAATTNKALEAYSRPLGAVVIFVGLATLALGTTRYFCIQSALVGGNYPVARVSTILLAFVMCAIIVAVFGIIVGVRSK